MVNPFKNKSDEELMELYQKGDHVAFENIYMRHKNRMFTYFSKRHADKSVVNDLFQSALLKFHNSRSNYDKQYALIKWVYTICRSVSIDHYRKSNTMADLVPLQEDFIAAEEREETHFDLESEKQLSDKERRAIDLRYYSEQEFLEISNILKISESNVRKIISRGIKKLRVKYQGGANE